MRTYSGFFFVCALELIWSGVSHGQTFYPGPAPTVGDIQHEVVDKDASLPTDRLEVGSAEEVTLGLDGASWLDVDYVETSYGCDPKYDGMGDVIWTITGPGSLYPLTGGTTYLTVDILDSDQDISISATVYDAGWFAQDPDPLLVQIKLAGKAPTSVIAITGSAETSYVDDPKIDKLATWPGAIRYGGIFYVTFQVQPVTVQHKIKIMYQYSSITFKWNTGVISDQVNGDAKIVSLEQAKAAVNVFKMQHKWGSYSVLNFNGKDLGPYTLGIDFKFDPGNKGAYSTLLNSGQLSYSALDKTKEAFLGVQPSSAGAKTDISIGGIGPWN
jgi:hypothetical protein